MSATSLYLPPETRVTCPECDHEFSLEEGFAKQALDTLAASSAQSLSSLRQRERSTAEKRANELAIERGKQAQQQVDDLRGLIQEQSQAHERALAEVKKLTERSFQPQLETLRQQLTESQETITDMDRRETALATREKEIETRVTEGAAARATELVASDRQAFEERLHERDNQLAESRASELTLRREKAAVEDRAAALEVEVARKLDAGRAEIEAKARANEQERASLEKAELQKTIEDMKGKLVEAQAKASQGSQQLQGEVLELALEEGLVRLFPLDTIEEVKKGMRGGDVIQRVVARSGQPAGTILWETKRAKDWSAAWVAKLKADMRHCGADVGVLVTMPTAVPKDWPLGQQFALVEEVWVVVWSVALQLAEVLRAALLDVHKQRLISAGKGEKMEALYDYVTSPQFAQKLRAVYDVFTKMREELESEKNQATQRWARREKQLLGGVGALLGIGGDVQGLAQQTLPELELEPKHQPPSSRA